MRKLLDAKGGRTRVCRGLPLAVAMAGVAGVGGVGGVGRDGGVGARGAAWAAAVEAPAAGAGASAAALDRTQAAAVGLQIARAVAARAPARLAALGLVLDPATLRADLDALAVSAATEQAAALELDRLQGLYAGGGQASARMVESARAARAKAQAELRAARARLRLAWAPLAAWTTGAQDELSTRAIDGASLLVRADVPGRSAWAAALPSQALIDIDGLEVPARVLGVLRDAGAVQSAALLLEVTAPPAGVSVGARVPVTLIQAVSSGLVLPRSAVLYDEHGAYVYKQSSGARGRAADGAAAGSAVGAGATGYVPVRVKLLAPYGSGWLVSGIDADDDIVVSGAGVLWSLKSVGAQASEDDED
jgi:hypothetical protein